jgi:hypothetical protein
LAGNIFRRPVWNISGSRAGARCTGCGSKGATLQHPGWGGNHVGFLPFPTQQCGLNVLSMDIRFWGFGAHILILQAFLALPPATPTFTPLPNLLEKYELSKVEFGRNR